MRVLRTEFYFDDRETHPLTGEKAGEQNFGVAAAFFKSEDSSILPSVIGDVLDGQLILAEDGAAARHFLPIFLENLFRGIEQPEDALIVRASREFEPYLRFFNDSTVVIEQSPPSGLEWQLMVKSASSVTIGTFVGLSIAPSNSPLLLLTIPAGIIVVGTAIGISRGLENGLNKKIATLINRRRLRS